MVSYSATFEGNHGSVTVRRPAIGVVVVEIKGADVGELGDAPFQELAKDFTSGISPHLFVDTRAALGATMDVSGSWARWLRENRASMRRMSMLTGTKFIRMTADFVSRFAELGDKMRIYTDAAAFDAELAAAVDA